MKFIFFVFNLIACQCIFAINIIPKSASFNFPDNPPNADQTQTRQGPDESQMMGYGGFDLTRQGPQIQPNQLPTGICICVTTGFCSLAGGGNGTAGTNDGSGVIDIRIVSNPNLISNPVSLPANTLIPVTSGLTPSIVTPTACATGLERCCPITGFNCGIRYPPVAGSRQPTVAQGQAQYGAYPWQAVILSPGDVYQGSGALIDQLHVLTAAHRVEPFLTNGQQLRVRLGEWDAATNTEPLPVLEYTVARIFINTGFNNRSLRNGVALLRLSTTVVLGQYPTITTACLTNNVPGAGSRCWISGWGRNDFAAGTFQAIQKEVDVPIIAGAQCQSSLQATRLGSTFQLDTTSFICAGGEINKDACTGDGGSPLVCQVGVQWYVVGLVAWGIGCGQAGVPGVYLNVASYIGWIQTTTRS